MTLTPNQLTSPVRSLCQTPLLPEGDTAAGRRVRRLRTIKRPPVDRLNMTQQGHASERSDQELPMFALGVGHVMTDELVARHRDEIVTL